MNAIKNTGFLNLYGNAIPAWTPSIGYVYTAGGTNTIVLTDNSTYPAADSIDIIQCEITDDNGISVAGKITVAGGGGALTLSTATLDATGGFNIKAMIVSTNGVRADMGQYGVGSSTAASGNLGYTNKQLQ